jgi:ATP-dependent helicase/nuclease subunit B
LGGEAEILRKGLFNVESLKTNKKIQTENIRLREAKDLQEEAEYIALQIRKQVIEGARYRDLAVLIPDTVRYSLPLKRAFEEYGIPYFFDEKKSLKLHPLCGFLLACLETVRDGFSASSVQALTQNVFFGESDEYRNYLLKYANFKGGAKRAIK